MGIIKAKSIPEKYFEEKCFISEILNNNDFKSFSIARCKVAPGVTTELHSLKDTTEVYYILSSKGKMEINGKEVGITEPGDIVFLPANNSQRITNINDEDLIFLCICSPRFVVDNYLQYS